MVQHHGAEEQSPFRSARGRSCKQRSHHIHGRHSRDSQNGRAMPLLIGAEMAPTRVCREAAVAAAAAAAVVLAASKKEIADLVEITLPDNNECQT